MHQLGDRVLDLEPGVHLQEEEPLGRRGRRGTRPCRRPGSRSPRRPCGPRRGGRRAPRRSGREPAPPRRPSGAGAAASSRGRRRRWCRRPGPRRGGRARRTARRRRCRRRTPTAPRPRPSRSRRAGPRACARPACRGRRRRRTPSPAGAGRPRSARSGVLAASGTPASRMIRLASIFEPIASIDSGVGPTQIEPGVDDRAREVGVLGQEPVAGVDRVGARTAGRVDDEVGAQVGVGRRVARQAYGVVGLAHVGQLGVGVGVDRDGLDAERAAGAEDPARDLGPVGDEQSGDRRRLTGGTPRIGRCRRTAWSRSPRGRCRGRCGCRAGR